MQVCPSGVAVGDPAEFTTGGHCCDGNAAGAALPAAPADAKHDAGGLGR